MSRRDVLRFATVGALVGLALVLGCSRARAMTVADAYARGTAYLEAQGVAINRRPVVIGDAGTMRACGGSPVVQSGIGCAGLSYPDRIEISQTAWDSIVIARRGWPPGPGFYVLLHEALHLPDHVGNGANEGATDALACDLYPGWVRAITGIAWPSPPPRYPREVQVVREASHRATGQPWRSWAARRWRRAYEQSSDELRAQMLAAAFGQGA